MYITCIVIASSRRGLELWGQSVSVVALTIRMQNVMALWALRVAFQGAELADAKTAGMISMKTQNLCMCMYEKSE